MIRRFLVFATLAIALSCAHAQTLLDLSRTKGNLPAARVQPGISGTQCLVTDAIITFWGACASGAGSGTVTNVSSGNLSPLFTVSVTNPTTTPALSFALSNAGPNTVFGNNTSGSTLPGFQALVLSQLPGSGSLTINTSSPLGGGGAISLGNSLTLTCSTCLTSAPVTSVFTRIGAITAQSGDYLASQVTNAFDIGIANTLTNVSAPGTPAAGKTAIYVDSVNKVLSSKNDAGAVSVTAVPLACTNQVFSSLGSSGSFSCHTITSTDTSGSFPASSHNLLSAAHSDTTAAAAVRGDGLFAIGATPTWQRVAHPGTNGYFKWNGTDIVASSGAASGTGTPTACTNQFVTSLTLNPDAAPTSACSTVGYAQVSGTPAIPTGSGFRHITAGVEDGTAKTVDVSGADITGVLKASAFPALTGDGTTAGGALAFTLATVATPGTSPKVTFNAKGLVTAGGPLVSGDIPNNAANTSGNAGTATAFDHTPTLCTAGNYPLGILASGAATGCTAASGAGTVTHTAGALTLNQLVFGNGAADIAVGDLTGDLTTSGGKATTLATVATPGTGLKTTINAKGLATAVNTAASTDLSDTSVIMRTNASSIMSAGTTIDMDTARAKYWGTAPIFDAAEYTGAGANDACNKIAAVEADAAYTAAGRAIIDVRGLQGSQNCSVNPFITSIPTLWMFGETHLSFSSLITMNTNPTSTTVPAPAAPTLATATTGGSLAAATTYGVKAALRSSNGSSFPSTEATKLTGAGATNTITMTKPAASFAAVCYDVYSATPIGSGWKLNNTSGCIPMSQDYVIKTVGAGAVPPAAATAFEDSFEIIGLGPSTVFSLDSTTAGFLIDHASNWNMRKLKITSSQVTSSANAALQLSVVFNALIDEVEFSGHGHQLLVDNGGGNVRLRNIRCGNLTIAGECILAVGPMGEFSVDGVIIEPGVWPALASLVGGVYIQNMTKFRVSNVSIGANDFSQDTNGAGVVIDNSSNGVVDTVNCNGLINADCVLGANLSHDITINNVNAKNMNLGTPLGTNANNGDCVDLFTVGQVTLNNIICADGNAIGGFKPPLLEIYNNQDITINNAQLRNGSGEGISTFGTLGARYAGINATLNQNTGMLVQDFTGTVSCNGTTTITRVSGEPFGPWAIGTPITVNSNPFTIAAIPTSTNSLTVNTTCATVASTTMTMSATDMTLSGNFDTNGRNGAKVACTSAGLCFSGGNRAQLDMVSANDNQTTKLQTCGIQLQGTARVAAVNFNGVGNFTAAICETAGTSAFISDDGSTPIWQVTGINTVGQASTVANSAAINTTETIINKTAALPPNRLLVGTVIHFDAWGTCTSTIGNTSTFTVRLGTAGTTSDTAVATIVTGVAGTTSTNIPFHVMLDFTVRTLGASGTGSIAMQLDSQGATGITTTSPQIFIPTMSAFNTTTANNIVSLSYKSAASTTTSTFLQVPLAIPFN